MHLFSREILKWYALNKRDLPWKNTTDVYKIWLSEIMLQQTQVAQVLPYYSSFLKAFPTIATLAKADETSVLKLWEGLGFYSRARNLHKSAKYIQKNYKGKFPTTYEDILKLKGVGKYSAAAIASFAFQLPKAIVDGNVSRVLARYFGIVEAVNSTQGEKIISKKADLLLAKDNSAEYNQAILDFGAKQCVPNKPQCESCPLKNLCLAFKKNLTHKIPYKIKKLKVKNRYFHYYFIHNDSHFYLTQRTKNDIWKNLFELPCIERKNNSHSPQLTELTQLSKLINTQNIDKNSIQKIKHILSHQVLHITFNKLFIKELPPSHPYKKIKLEDWNTYPMPIVIKNYLAKHCP